ncbi:CinY protein [Streptomyces antibioticus]|uniref:CinY protein n=1 Tax=Streptomyces antibioticus TaxID=1890 RepID=UPI0019605851|nr:CinY protein [Streptomyces sp. S9]
MASSRRTESRLGAFAALGVALLALSTAVLSPSPAAAFGTINGTIDGHRQNAEHEKITRLALECRSGMAENACFEPRSLDQLAGHTGTFGAVGSPDTTSVGVEEAHCDDADFGPPTALPVTPGSSPVYLPYPRTRAEATDELLECISYLKGKFSVSIGEAGDLVSATGQYDPAESSLSRDCNFVVLTRRDKCEAIDGFGQALHGIQDFYAHSNWADREDSSRSISLTNPAGLNRTGRAPFLDMNRGPVRASEIPHDLSTGCVHLVADASRCLWRIRHDTINKDTGSINVATGSIGSGTTPRGSIQDNFRRAVEAAIYDTRYQWGQYRDRLKQTYGESRGEMIACFMTHDRPENDCLPV